MLRVAIACHALLFGLVVAAGIAAAATTTVEVSVNRGSPGGIAVQILDARTGAIIAEGRTDDSGHALFESLQPERPYQAQTADGEFGTATFQAGDSATLRVRVGASAVRPGRGWMLSVAARLGGSLSGYEVEHRNDLGTGALQADVSDHAGDGDWDLAARVFSPSLRPIPWRPRAFVELGVGGDFGGAGLESSVRTGAGERVETESSFVRWAVGAGLSQPLLWGPRWWHIDLALRVGQELHDLELEVSAPGSRDRTSGDVALLFVEPMLELRADAASWGRTQLSIGVGAFVRIFPGDDRLVLNSQAFGARFEATAARDVVFGGWVGVHIGYDQLFAAR